MKTKYIHLALASLVLASCGGNSSSASSTAVSLSSSQAPDVSSSQAPDVSSQAPDVSSQAPSSSGVASTSSATTPTHDKAKTIENILAAKTYRLDNFMHVEAETNAENGAGAPSIKSTAIVDGHNYFEVHGSDSVFWDENSTVSQVKLSDYLVQAHMTLEQFKQMLPMMEASGMKITIDEENDLLTMDMGSLLLDKHKTYSFYNTDIEQYEQYVYTVDKEGGEICAKSSYVLDRDALALEVPTFVNELVLYTLDKGTFNPEECSYTITDINKDELSPLFQESIATLANGLTLTIKDDYPEQLLLDIDLETLTKMNGAPEGAAILVSAYGIAFDYKGPFLDITGKRVGVDCEYQHHGYSQYEYYEDGYRLYCGDCYQYLGEKQNYSFDSTYHVCTKSGYIDGLGLGKEETYAGLIYADEEAEYYAFSYQNNEKYGTKWNASVFEVKRIDPSAGYDMEIYSTYFDDALYRYWAEAKALVVEKTVSRDPLSDGCRVVCKQNLSFYKNVDLDVDLIQNEDDWRIAGGDSLAEAIKSMTPEETIDSFYLSEEHKHTHESTYKGDGCDTLHVEVCDDCGETVTVRLSPTNHAFENGEVLTYADLSAFLDANEAYNPWDESDNITLIVKATCTKCENPVIFVITPEYTNNGNYWIGSFDMWGDFSFDLTNDPLPTLNDAAGQPIFPIAK